MLCVTSLLSIKAPESTHSLAMRRARGDLIEYLSGFVVIIKGMLGRFLQGVMRTEQEGMDSSQRNVDSIKNQIGNGLQIG